MQQKIVAWGYGIDVHWCRAARGFHSGNCCVAAPPTTCVEPLDTVTVENYLSVLFPAPCCLQPLSQECLQVEAAYSRAAAARAAAKAAAQRAAAARSQRLRAELTDLSKMLSEVDNLAA